MKLRFCPSVYACMQCNNMGCKCASSLCRNDVDTEFETKAFQVCDKDGDGALDWQEVENCEVNKRHFLKNGLGNILKENLGCTSLGKFLYT